MLSNSEGRRNDLAAWTDQLARALGPVEMISALNVEVGAIGKYF